MNPKQQKIIEHNSNRIVIQIAMACNAGESANSVNGLSFSELMRQLRGEG